MISNWKKGVSLGLAFSLVAQMCWPVAAWAIGGPTQPEVQSFSPGNTGDMVDLFSGDFKYNIKLLEVGDYPINLSYASGLSMDQEASWVGLGWNINPGVINRNMRGIPDEFNGDVVTKSQHMKANKTIGIGNGGGAEIVGLPEKGSGVGLGLDVGKTIFYNTYKGWGYDINVDATLQAGSKGKTTGTLGLGLDFNSQEGIGINPSLGFSTTQHKSEDRETSYGFQASAPFNSRSGVKALSLGFSAKTSNTALKDYKGHTHSETLSNMNGGYNLNFNDPTNLPKVTMPMKNLSFSFRFTYGQEFEAVNPHVYFNGYYTSQEIKPDEEETALPAYGYMNIQNGQFSDSMMLDFNREKEMPFNRNLQNLPLTNFTYDIYSVQAEGLGASFRPHRSEIGIVYDRPIVSTSEAGNLGVEFGNGDLFKVGTNIGLNYSESGSGGWYGLAGKFKYKGRDDISDNEYLYEPWYFKNAGEKAAIDEDYYNRLGRDHKVAIKLDKQGDAVGLYDFEGEKDLSGLQANNRRMAREKRNQVMYFLTAEQATKLAMDKSIASISENAIYNSQGQFPATLSSRINQKPQHHISEVTVLKEDGKRYIFGIPAYNNTQRESSFNVTGRSGNRGIGLVNYDPVDNTTFNGNGTDQFYSGTTLPPYAHSYLLTEVLSTDYVDVSGDGVSDDDLGTATKINYTRITDHYNWRVPFGKNKASYSEGLRTDKKDDRGSVLYGQKEVWYVHSIESKKFIAEFKISERKDGFGVASLNGGLDSGVVLRKLDRIELYSKEDRMRYGRKAKPIKVVHFEYSYKLCPFIDNNNGVATDKYGLFTAVPAKNVNLKKGKLTLDRIYFTYEKSTKGKTEEYRFNYSSFNPKYNIKGSDRWGTYKPNPDSATCLNDSDPNAAPSNADCPYTPQNRDSAAKYASAWTLNKISLPGGGEINVDYEADDYGYVQDKRAMQMVKVTGCGTSATGTAAGRYLFTGKTPHNFVYFDLPSPLDTSKYTKGAADLYIHDQFLDGDRLGDVFFKFLVNLKDDGYEYVPGYTGYKSAGVLPTTGSNYTQGYIELNESKLDGSRDTINPIAGAAWQFLRLNATDLLYPPAPTTSLDPAIVGKSMVNFATDIKRIFKGYTKMCIKSNYGRKFTPNKSYIRLFNPAKKKFGGGLRVSKIRMKDNWDKMEGSGTGTVSEYGQVYDYTTTDTMPGGKVRTISSGVASYEPMIGGEENPWHTPMAYKESHKLVPDNEHYQETPYGESFFPGAAVGYSKVTVTSIPHTGVQRTATGKSVSEFYTAKDFPVIVKQTSQIPVQQKSTFLEAVFFNYIEDYVATTQGYCIELNDMNGKPKAKLEYAENKAEPISGMRYYYKTETNNPKMLNNETMVVTSGDTLKKAIVGVDVDMVSDMAEDYSLNRGTSLGFNLDLVNVGKPPIPPVPIFTFWPSLSSEDTRLRTGITTKVVMRYGLMDRVEAFDNASRVVTKTLAFDAKTGETLLTSLNNEWNDTTYNFTYPAHWAYTGMGQASQNIMAEFKDKSIVDGILQEVPQKHRLFEPGDEVAVSKQVKLKDELHYWPPAGFFEDRLWVTRLSEGLVFMDRQGQRQSFLGIQGGDQTGGEDRYNITILRSGHRNQQGSPIGTITTLSNPMKDGVGHKLILDKNILTTSAQQFDEEWRNFGKNNVHLVCGNISEAAKQIPKLLTALNRSKRYCYKGFCGPSGTDSTHIWNDTNFYHPSNGINIVPFHLDTTDLTALKDTLINTMYVGADTVCKPCVGYIRFDRFSKYRQPDKPVLHGLLTTRGTTACPSCSKDYKQCELFLNSRKNAWFDFADTDIVRFDNLEVRSARVGANYNFKVKVYYRAGSGKATDIIEGVSCIKICDCHEECLPYSQNQVVNPYIAGIKGNWRPKRSHVFLDKRSKVDVTKPANIRKDGTMIAYRPFWKLSIGDSVFKRDVMAYKWAWNSEVTKYSPYGQELENRDPLERRTAALYDFFQSVPSAIVSNSKYRQCAYDAFEDYDNFFFSRRTIGSTTQLCEPPTHFRFGIGNRGWIDSNVSHTGTRSVFVKPDSAVKQSKPIFVKGPLSAPNDYFILLDSNIIEEFNPEADGSKYLVSIWTKQKIYSFKPASNTYNQPELVITITGGSGSVPHSFYPKGPIIEGWQLISDTFSLRPGSNAIEIKLKGGTTGAYYDDLRIQPFNSNMKTYVYNPVNLKQMAEADENNYSTIYEYNDEGQLIRVKKETEKGVMTVKEARESRTKYKTRSKKKTGGGGGGGGSDTL